MTGARPRCDLTARLLSSFAATLARERPFESTEVLFMNADEPTYFDIETVNVLREILEHAWTCLRPDQQAKICRSLLAERFLKAAAAGERDRERLLSAALDISS